jgi:hypothetical protein
VLEQLDDPFLDNGGRVPGALSHRKNTAAAGVGETDMCSGVTPGDHFLALREKLVLKVIYTPFTSLGILRFFSPSDITFFLFQKLFYMNVK